MFFSQERDELQILLDNFVLRNALIAAWTLYLAALLY